MSQEFTVYSGQNLTLSCQPRDSPPDLVYWYRIDKDSRDQELYHSTGPTHTITNATIDDIGVYFCAAVEWGFWVIRSYIFVNVIGELLCLVSDCIVSCCVKSCCFVSHKATR